MSAPAPYYAAGGITIYHGDCLSILPSLGSADAVITDAPYGISDKPRRGKRGGRASAGDNTYHPPSDWDHAIDPAWAAACKAAAPVVAWFGYWRQRGMLEQHFGMPAQAEIVWYKDMHCGPPCPVARQDERIWLFAEQAIRARRFDTSVWSEPVIPTWAHRHHKNEKPEGLMRRLVALLLGPGDTLIDPFMGSGTTLRAAKDLGVRAIGIDISEAYCRIAAARMRQEVLIT